MRPAFGAGMVDAPDPLTDAWSLSALSRLSALALSGDGERLVAVMQSVDPGRSTLRPSLWEIALDGGRPHRLTEPDQPATAPVFLPDGSLVVVGPGTPVSGRAPEPSLWRLVADGRLETLMTRPGGLSAPVVASAAGTVVARGARLASSGPDDDDGARREERSQRGVGAVLHTGMPVRHPFHELDVEHPQLIAFSPEGSGPTGRDLAPDAGRALVLTNGLAGDPSSISADGRLLVTPWSRRVRRGAFPAALAVIDVGTGARRVVLSDDSHSVFSPRISPDGRRVAVLVRTEGTFDEPTSDTLRVVDLTSVLPLDSSATGGYAEEPSSVDLELGDVHPREWAWAPDSRSILVSGDLRGAGAVVAVSGVSGEHVGQLAADAVYSSLCPSPDGRWLYALRSTIDTPATPVRLATQTADQRPLPLVSPAWVGPVPGRLERVETAVPDGSGVVPGYLCLPRGASSDAPAPLLTMIHGGPAASHNAWSWRQNPWFFVARGWAVLLPDPALSTGYGAEWAQRAWPHRARRVWQDIEALLDAATERPEVDGRRLAALGASFGGFMTNWIAGHSDRFRAIVTHSGLYALDQEHDTTDAARLKYAWFGTRRDHPEWYAENSPEGFVERIRTPMLLVHGNGDYNVPIGEAQRLWWDLVSTWDGEPDALPHRFLRYTNEHHWILGLSNGQIWYETVASFLEQHVLGGAEVVSALL